MRVALPGGWSCSRSACFSACWANEAVVFSPLWTFSFVTAIFIAGWMVVNAAMARSFDAYPCILLNLVLACLAMIQARCIMTSQNRQAARYRAEC